MYIWDICLGWHIRTATLHGETSSLRFRANRQVVSEEGSTELVPISIEAPLLSLVNLYPAFVMDEATVRFNMEVTEQTLSKQTGTEEVVSEFGASLLGMSWQIYQVRYLQLLKIQDKLMIRRNMRFMPERFSSRRLKVWRSLPAFLLPLLNR